MGSGQSISEANEEQSSNMAQQSPCPSLEEARSSDLDRRIAQRLVRRSTERSLEQSGSIFLEEPSRNYGRSPVTALDSILAEILDEPGNTGFDEDSDEEEEGLAVSWVKFQSRTTEMGKFDELFSLPEPLNALRFLSELTSTPVKRLSKYFTCASFLSPEDEYYEEIIDYINNSQESVHKFGIDVISIVQIQRADELFNDIVFGEGNRGTMLWHGTTAENVHSILENGVELPPSNHQRLLQGRGIYFADRVSKSAQYCDSQRKPSPNETGVLLLCNVNLGMSHFATKPNHGLTSPPRGFNSVICEGRKIPCPSNEKVVNGMIFPSGKSVDNPYTSDCMVEFNEYTVYNPKQVEIRYLIYFTFSDGKWTN